MLKITDAASMARALDSPIDRDLKRFLTVRRDQLMDDTDNEYALGELAHFIVTKASDTIADIEAEAAHPIITNPAFEWVVDHGRWYEAVTILSDDGFGVVLFVPNEHGIEPRLLHLLRAEAVATTAAANRDQTERANHM